MPYLAQDEGLFEKEGVVVQLETAPGGGQMQLPLVVGAEFDLGVAGAGDVLALSQSSPLVAIVGVGSVFDGDLDTTTSALITDDPAITRPADFQGRTVALNSIGGQIEASVKALVHEDGGDPAKVTFVQVPVQNSVTAVANGQVDVSNTSEPFLTLATEEGMRSVASVEHPVDGLPGATYFGTKENVAARSEDIDAFIRAMQSAAEIANEDPELVRDLIAKHTETDPVLLDRVTKFPVFAETGDASTYQAFARFMANWDAVPAVPAEQDWLYVPAD